MIYKLFKALAEIVRTSCRPKMSKKSLIVVSLLLSKNQNRFLKLFYVPRGFPLLKTKFIFIPSSPFNVKFKSEIISIIAQSITSSAEEFDSGCHPDLMDVIVFHKFGTLIQYLLRISVHFLLHGALITAYLSGYCIALHNHRTE